MLEVGFAFKPAPAFHTLRNGDGYYLFHVESTQLLEVSAGLWNQVASDPHGPRVQRLLAQMPTAADPSPDPIDITAIALNVVEKCNLRCTYCYAGDGNYGADTVMSFDMAKRTITFFTEGRDRFHITFFGGEPLLNFRLIQDVVEWCATLPVKFTFALTTNGTLLGSSHLAFFRHHRFALKVSYDGKGLQEKQRLSVQGDSVLAGAVESRLNRLQDDLGRLRSFNLRSTISRAHIDDFATSVLATLNSHNYALSFARVASKHRKDIFTPEDVQHLSRAYDRVIDTLLGDQDYPKLLRILNLKQQILRLHQGSPRKSYCAAGLNYVSVSTAGKFYICHRFTEDSAACVGDMDQGLDTTRLAAIQNFRSRTTEPCNTCWMKNLCGGGCLHEHRSATGDALTVDPTFCQIQEMEIKAALRVYLAIRAAGAESLLC